MELEFSFKYKNYELRACPKHLVHFHPDDKNETIDLVRWEHDGEKPYCFSLAYFRRNDEGYSLYFVGGRPFRYIDDKDVKVLWLALKHAQEILDEFFDMEDEDD